jgi:hypothetical protein
MSRFESNNLESNNDEPGFTGPWSQTEKLTVSGPGPVEINKHQLNSKIALYQETVRALGG